VNKVRIIGATHAGIGLEPQWYIGSYAIILDHLINSAVTATSPQQFSEFFDRRHCLIDTKPARHCIHWEHQGQQEEAGR
jgi:hypothetical protein